MPLRHSPRYDAAGVGVVVIGGGQRLFLSNCCRVRGETPAFERAVLAVGLSFHLWRLSVCCVVSIRVCASPPPKRARTDPAAFPSGLLLAPFNVSHAPRGIAARLVPNFPNIGVAPLGAAMIRSLPKHPFRRITSVMDEEFGGRAPLPKSRSSKERRLRRKKNAALVRAQRSFFE